MAEKKNTQKAAKSNGMTKMDGVKQALDALGPKAKPAEIKDYLEKQLGLEISLGVATSYKKEWAKRARAAAGGKAVGKPAVKATVAKKAVPTPVPAAAQTRPASPPRPAPAKEVAGGIDLKDIAAAKGLVERVGAGRLRELIDLLAK